MRHRPRLASVVVLVVAGAFAQCKREEVSVATLLIDGDDGGALRGFACVEPSDVDASAEETSAIRCVLEACSTQCLRRDAGANCFESCSHDAALLAQCSPRAKSGAPMLARATSGQLCVVFDYLRAASDIECRSTPVMLDWCALPQHGNCPVVQRRVIPVRLPDAGAAALLSTDETVVTAAINASYAAIRNAVIEASPITSNAPDGWVFVRMAAVVASSPDCAAERDPARPLAIPAVVGCALSCAYELSSRSEVNLVLDEGYLTACTARQVDVCAAIGTSELPVYLADARSAGSGG